MLATNVGKCRCGSFRPGYPRWLPGWGKAALTAQQPEIQTMKATIKSISAMGLLLGLLGAVPGVAIADGDKMTEEQAKKTIEALTPNIQANCRMTLLKLNKLPLDSKSVVDDKIKVKSICGCAVEGTFTKALTIEVLKKHGTKIPKDIATKQKDIFMECIKKFSPGLIK